MLAEIASMNCCWVDIPAALAARGLSRLRMGRGQMGYWPILGMVAHRGPDLSVGFVQELAARLEADLGVGQRRHLELDVHVAHLLAGETAGGRLQLAGKVAGS